jgi:hypothetical protein
VNQVDGKSICDRVQLARIAAGDSPWLVGYDANGIQELITASGRPISMRGASEVLKSFDGWAEDSELSIFAGGGRGVFLARSEREAHETVRVLVNRYRDATRGGIMAACTVPLTIGGSAEAQSIRWLRNLLDVEKDAARPHGGLLPDTKDAECAYCQVYRGTRRRKRDDREELVCARCDAMLDQGQKVGRDRGSHKGEMSLSIANIATRGRIAVVSADGNNLGALFASLHSLVELALVSKVVAAIFETASKRALECVGEEKRVPLASGGDDIRAFLPPGSVLRYVTTLVDVVESSARDHARELHSLLSPAVAEQLGKLGIGIGAVIADVYYPAWRLVEHAHALERSAKRASYQQGDGATQLPARSTFDFAVITTEAAMTDEPRRGPTDIRPLRPGTEAWQIALRRAEALARIPSAQLSVLADAEALELAAASYETASLDEHGRWSTLDADQAELRNVLCYQVARSPRWQAWFETCDIDWRIPENVVKHRPDSGTLELARLLEFQEAP